MLHDQIYHYLIMPMQNAVLNQMVAKRAVFFQVNGPSYNHKACGAVAKRQCPVLKRAGLRTGRYKCHYLDLVCDFVEVSICF